MAFDSAKSRYDIIDELNNLLDAALESMQKHPQLSQKLIHAENCGFHNKISNRQPNLVLQECFVKLIRLPDEYINKIFSTCTICEYSTTNSRYLLNHIALHTTKTAITCNICNYRVKHTSILRSHMRIHTGEKPFICNICGRSFTWKFNLATHIRVHSREKPFNCNLCGRRFTRKQNLVKHKRKHGSKNLDSLRGRI